MTTHSKWTLSQPVVVAVVLVVALVAFPETDARAAHSGGYWHGWSNGSEGDDGNSYTGVAVSRQDIRPAGQTTNGNCGSLPWVAGQHPVYQTQWVILPSSATGNQEWIEFGSAHWCGGDYHRRYWGEGINGTWWPRGGTNFSLLNTTRRFRLKRENGADWYVDVDGGADSFVTTKPREGTRVMAGYESWARGVDVPEHGYRDLEYRNYTNRGNWQNWAGRDGRILRADVNGTLDNFPSELCGIWGSDSNPSDDNTWLASENQPCGH